MRQVRWHRRMAGEAIASVAMDRRREASRLWSFSVITKGVMIACGFAATQHDACVLCELVLGES